MTSVELVKVIKHAGLVTGTTMVEKCDTRRVVMPTRTAQLGRDCSKDSNNVRGDVWIKTADNIVRRMFRNFSCECNYHSKYYYPELVYRNIQQRRQREQLESSPGSPDESKGGGGGDTESNHESNNCSLGQASGSGAGARVPPQRRLSERRVSLERVQEGSWAHAPAFSHVYIPCQRPACGVNNKENRGSNISNKTNRLSTSGGGTDYYNKTASSSVNNNNIRDSSTPLKQRFFNAISCTVPPESEEEGEDWDPYEYVVVGSGSPASPLGKNRSTKRKAPNYTEGGEPSAKDHSCFTHCSSNNITNSTRSQGKRGGANDMAEPHVGEGRFQRDSKGALGDSGGLPPLMASSTPTTPNSESGAESVTSEDSMFCDDYTLTTDDDINILTTADALAYGQQHAIAFAKRNTTAAAATIESVGLAGEEAVTGDESDSADSSFSSGAASTLSEWAEVVASSSTSAGGSSSSLKDEQGKDKVTVNHNKPGQRVQGRRNSDNNHEHDDSSSQANRVRTQSAKKLATKRRMDHVGLTIQTSADLQAVDVLDSCNDEGDNNKTTTHDDSDYSHNQGAAGTDLALSQEQAGLAGGPDMTDSGDAGPSHSNGRSQQHQHSHNNNGNHHHHSKSSSCSDVSRAGESERGAFGGGDSCFHEDREFDFLKAEPVRRSTSLKTYKTPPGTPHRKKGVRFADALGLDLESVRHILNLDDPPEVPKSAMEHLRVGLETEQPASGVRYLSALFSQPGANAGFMRRVSEGKVVLENCVVDDKDLTIAGIVRVANIDFHKKVLVRYTTNGWLTSSDVAASYVHNSNDGATDRFSFTLTVPKSFAVGQRLEMALMYTSGGQTFWDNNHGKNYAVECYARALPTCESDNTWMHFL